MSMSLLNFFKRKPGKPAKPQTLAAPPLAQVVDKPNSDRFSKTVLPNATRAPLPHDPFQVGGNPHATAENCFDLPPAIAFALAPKIERVLPFTLADVLGQMPAGLVRPVNEGDLDRGILLKAAELERGMADGKPTVSIATIYQQVPEIFLRPVEPGDDTQVALPFSKVLEQFANLHSRSDQHQEQAVPHVETPFLKVALEDDSKFGTNTAPLKSDSHPSVKVLHATAESFAAAEPEATAKETVAAPSLPPRPAIKLNGAAAAKPPAKAPSAAPTRIPFTLTPNGTGVPAAERVPASSGGASVPTSFVPPLSAPTRIPFNPPTPEKTAPDAAEPWLTKENFGGSDAAKKTEEPAAPVTLSFADSGPKISLPLKLILQALPPFQLTGDIKTVPDDSMIELPFSLVEPQLASGRIGVKPDDFAACLPDEFRGLFSAKEIATPVLLPLQEVLKNLPSAALRMRDDQIEQERGANFDTPFAAAAAEDAKRLKRAAVASPQPKSDAATEPHAPQPAAAIKRSPLQEMLETDEAIDPKAVVAYIEKMPAVEGCAIMFGDGLNLAGQLPESYEADGLCAMAPSLLQRVENHMAETKLGSLSATTFSCSKASVTFSMQDNLCLAALHKSDLAADVRTQLGHIVQELSKTYSKPA